MLDASLTDVPTADMQDTRWQHVLGRLEGAYAPQTLASYLRYFSQFARWCRSVEAICLPAAPQRVAAYIEHRSNTLKPPSLMQNAKVIGLVHLLAEEEDPTKDFEVYLALRRAIRCNPYRQRQAFGLTCDILQKLVDTCPDTLHGSRDKALLWVGLETLCRGSELASILVEDVRRSPHRTMTVTIRKGKTDKAGRGRTVVLSTPTAELVEHWLTQLGATTGPLLPRLDRHATPLGTLRVADITQILRARARLSRFPDDVVAQISSHSLRVGGAQQLTMNNRNLAQIMRAGGWRSVGSVSRYIEGAELSVWDRDGATIVLPVATGKPFRTKGWT